MRIAYTAGESVTWKRSKRASVWYKSFLKFAVERFHWCIVLHYNKYNEVAHYSINETAAIIMFFCKRGVSHNLWRSEHGSPGEQDEHAPTTCLCHKDS